MGQVPRLCVRFGKPASFDTNLEALDVSRHWFREAPSVLNSTRRMFVAHSLRC